MSMEKIVSTQECYSIVKNSCKVEDLEIINSKETKLYSYTNNNFYVYFSINIEFMSEKCREELNVIGKSWKTSLRKASPENQELLIYEYGPIHLPFFPKLLYRSDNLLVFGDYFKQGFKFVDENDMFDIEHIKLALKCLAFFHAESVSEKSEKECHNSGAKLDETNCTYKSHFEELKNTSKILSKFGAVNEKLRQNLGDIVNFAINLASSRKFRKVLCHGFAWDRKSWLFKYDEQQRPVDCLLINYENVHYDSPVLDVLQFVFMVTNLKSRQIFLDELLRWYYSQLKLKLSARYLDVNEIISQKEDFDIAVYCNLPLVKLMTVNYKAAQYSCEKLLAEPLTELEYLIENRDVLLEDVFVIVKNKLETTNFVILNYTLQPLGIQSGFLSQPNRLTIEVSTGDDKNVNVLQFFVKLIPKTQVQVNFGNDADAFYKEIFMYDDLIPYFKMNGLDLVDECAAKCYFTRYNHLLVLEDCSLENYRTMDCRATFSCELVELIIKKVAKWHACSWIVEERMSQKRGCTFCFIDHYPRLLREGLMLKEENHLGARCIEVGIDGVYHQLELFMKHGLVDCKLDWPTITAKFGEKFDLMYELVKPSKKFRNVVCHGDMWSNNILIKFENGVPVDCRLIDFQLSRYCPPAQDLLSLMYITMEKHVLNEKLYTLIDLYYREVDKILSEYSIDVNAVIPYEEFLKSVEYMKPQALCQAVLYHQLTLINEDIMKAKLATEEEADAAMMKNRRPLLTHLFENDFLYRARATCSLSNLIEMCQQDI